LPRDVSKHPYSTAILNGAGIYRVCFQCTLQNTLKNRSQSEQIEHRVEAPGLRVDFRAAGPLKCMAKAFQAVCRVITI
jgi:hypothetical protein